MKLICVDEQSFPKIREKGGVYIDKTRQVYDLFKDGTYFFISRPRRFGKSLLCSTLAALFSGKKELFKDLWIEQSDWQWVEHPVIYFDMTRAMASDGNLAQIRSGIAAMLKEVGEKYGIESIDTITGTPADFAHLIRRLYQKTGKSVVVIVDEYDKPLLDVIMAEDLYEPVHVLLRDLYSQLKASSDFLRFVFLTGVFKFAKTSIFSGLNNITDITFDPGAAELLGYTEQELTDNFSEHIEALADGYHKTIEEMRQVLREKYNGYAFGIDDKAGCVVGSVYNPFALNHVFHSQQLLDRWFASGTPTFLVQKLKEHEFVGIDSSALQERFSVLERSCEPGNITELPLMYYAGYITMKSYNRSLKMVAFDFPNIGIAQSLSEYLLPEITQKPETAFTRFLSRLSRIFYNQELEDLKDVLNQALANIPYLLHISKESYYQTIIYMLFNMCSLPTVAEDMVNAGRADLVIVLPKAIYILELKMDQSALAAIQQIKDRGYAEKYRHFRRAIYLVGIELSKEDRVVNDVCIEKIV